MDDVPPARFHLIALGNDLAVLLSSIFVKGFMLVLSKNDALEEAADFVLGKVVGELAHFI